MEKKQYNIRFKMAVVIPLVVFIFTAFDLSWAVTPSEYTASPIIGTTSEPPLVMLVMGRDHKLYYEAYNDASDLNDDGELDIRYDPAIEYYGYFDSYKYYEYMAASERFEPVGYTSDKKKARRELLER